MKANARANQLLSFCRLALVVARCSLPERGHKFSPKLYTQPQLLGCLLLKEFLRLDYRGVQDLLEVSDGLRAALGLEQVPDHSTLWWFAQRKLDEDRLQVALAETVHCLGAEQRRHAEEKADGDAVPPTGLSDQVALDSTGLFLGYSSRYFAWRAKRDRGQRGWLKWAGALWIGPQLLLAQRVRPGPCGDYGDLVPLASAAFAVRRFAQLIADGGYDSEANHRYCHEQLGVESLIPAHNKRGTAARTPHRLRMQILLGAPSPVGAQSENTALARHAYRQRWKAETLMSVLKRKWGENLSARSDLMQRKQALLRGLIYNLRRLVLLGVWRVAIWLRPLIQSGCS